MAQPVNWICITPGCPFETENAREAFLHRDKVLPSQHHVIPFTSRHPTGIEKELSNQPSPRLELVSATKR